MLPAKRRIQKTAFKSFGRGLSYHSPLLFLSVYKKANQLEQKSASQFSFVCSKKVARSAVARNLLRRRGYASIEKVIANIQPGYYFVFSFKKGAEVAKFTDISEHIQFLLKKAECY